MTDLVDSGATDGGVQSFCRVCHHCCPIVVETADGVAVAVHGDPINPTYQGYTCVKGRAQPAMLRHPDRLLRSLKRVPSGGFEPIRIEQALDEIADRLAEIIERHGPRSVASYFGTMAATNATVSPLLYAFMKGIGSPMQFTPNTIDKPGKAIAKALHGGWMAPPQGFDRPDVALMIGINPIVSYQGAPFGNPAKWLNEHLRSGMKLVVIDPRRTDVARRATLHLQPRPGHDIPLVAGMLRVIIDSDWSDSAFLAAHADGLAELRRHLEPFDPVSVAAAADVDAADVVEAARLFAQAKRGFAIAGTGPSMSGSGTLLEYLVLDLVTICGRWLRAGERVRNVATLIPALPAKAQPAPPRPAYGFGEKLRVRGLADTAAGLPTAAAVDEMLLPGPGQVRALLSCGGNPAAAWPDHGRTIEALNGLDLLVQVDPWMSETAKRAHYVIAPTMPLERADVTVLHDLPMAPHLGPTDSWAQYAPAVVDRPQGSDLIEDWEFFFGLAQRMGVDLTIDTQLLFPIPPVRLDTSSRPTTDELLQMLTAHGRVPLDAVKAAPHGAAYDETEVVVAPPDPDWPHRLQLAASEMMRDLDAFAAARVDSEAERAFRLVCRRPTQAYNSSCIDESTHRGRLDNPAFIHPDDLVALGLQGGDLVELASASATILALVEPDPNLRRGLVSISFGYGRGSSVDEADVRAAGTNVNVLLRLDEKYDAYSGQPRMSNVPVTVRPAGQTIRVALPAQ